MSDEEKEILLSKIKKGLIDMAWADIEKASAGGSKMGAFILCSCYIDYLAGFRFGKPGTGTEYKKFIEIYLQNYNPETIYTDMRCGIVHNYTEGGSYVFVHSLPNFHFYNPGGIGKTTLNLENFMADIKQAAETYLGELSESDELIQLAAKRMAMKDILQTQDHL